MGYKHHLGSLFIDDQGIDYDAGNDLLDISMPDAPLVSDFERFENALPEHSHSYVGYETGNNFLSVLTLDAPLMSHFEQFHIAANPPSRVPFNQAGNNFSEASMPEVLTISHFEGPEKSPAVVASNSTNVRVSSSAEPPASMRKRKAPTLRDADWEPHKARIIELHIDQRRPLLEVRATMERESGLSAE